MSVNKFRAWDKTNKQMLYLPDNDNDVSSWQFFTDGSVSLTEQHFGEKRFLPEFDADNLTVMQWTGTYDKNRVPIYESDIIHVSREIIHVDPEYRDMWDNPNPVRRDQFRAQLIRDKLVLIGDYEEYGVVKKSQVRWAMHPYIFKRVSFEHSQVNATWSKASRARQLRINRGLWIVEVVGTIQEHPELLDVQY